MKYPNENAPQNKLFLGGTLIAVLLFCYVLLCPALYADANSRETQRYMQIFQSVFSFIERNYVDETDASQLYEGAMKGLLESLNDPYSSYLDPKMMADLSDTTVGSFGGVGLQITKPVSSSPDKPAYVEVVSPIEDAPGWKAGIQPGDKLTEINGVPTPEITMDEVLAMLRGKPGEAVGVKVLRGKNIEFEVTLVKAIIEVPTVKYDLINDSIGYLRITEFTPLTAEKSAEAVKFFDAAQYRGLIIDLRNNPGGLITSAVDVADLFISNGTIVSTKSRIDHENYVYGAHSSKTIVPPHIPIVVLINKGSASASEILAGALKDYARAYIVGETSFGKGSVQQVLQLMNDDGLKLTFARYYTPSDANIDKIGITPDRIVLFHQYTDDEEKIFRDLVAANVIEDYVDSHPNMTDADSASFAAELKEDYPLEERDLRRLINIERYRTEISPIYDLDYDVQLNAAVAILEEENVAELLKKTLTVKETQESAVEESAQTASAN